MVPSANDLRQSLIVPPDSRSPQSSLNTKPTSNSQPLGLDSLRSRLQAKANTRDIKMEVQTPMQPFTLPTGHAANDPVNNGVFKLDDFLKAEKHARDAANASAIATPPPKKGKPSQNVAPLVPVAIGARSSKHTILLHDKYQKLGIPQPVFMYGGGGDIGWTVEVNFPGLKAGELQGIKEKGRFNSKQEAKEASSKTALKILERLESEGKVKKVEKSKRKSVSAAVPAQQGKVEKEPGPNYVGQLLEFQRATSSPQPTYSDYQMGTRFACLLRIEGHPNDFGSLESLHSSKKAARQDAAGHAVAFFKSRGDWPEDSTSVGGIKKKKKPQPTRPGFISSSTPSTPNAKNPSTATVSPGSMSFAQQVATLAVILALPTPEWRYTPHPSDKDFHSVSCFFKGGGEHEGPIGEVRNIFGKKRAKEECARLTLEYLIEVRDQRVSYGIRMMEGVAGGGGFVGAATGRAVDGEAEAARLVVGEGSEEGEGECEFEDAVEDLGV